MIDRADRSPRPVLSAATQKPLVPAGRHVDALVVQMVAWFVVTVDLIVEAGVSVSVPEIVGGAAAAGPSVIVITHGATVVSVYAELVKDAFALIGAPAS